MSEHRLEPPIESPEDDVAEQGALVDPEDDGDPPDHSDGSLEVDPADRAEQDRTVSRGDDDYR